MNFLAAVAFNAIMLAAFHHWTDNTDWGGRLKKYLQEWRTGSLLHLIFCAVTVFIFAQVGILLLVLFFRALGCK